MKKILLVFLCIGITNSICTSQLRFGVQAGINYGNILNTLVPFDNDEYDNLLSYRAGLTVSYPINNWKISSGFLLSARGTCTRSFFYPGKVPQIFGFYEIPLIVSRFIHSNKLELGFGLVYAMDGGRAVSLIGDKKYEVDLQMSIAWNINRRFSLEAAYLYGGIDSYISNRETYLYSVGSLSLKYNFATISFSKKHR